jgi:hypothetical protein
VRSPRPELSLIFLLYMEDVVVSDPHDLSVPYNLLALPVVV